jgi:uncharacterized RDD family membrane protein YckC
MNEPHLASAEFGGFWIRFFALLVDSAVIALGMALIIAGAAAALGGEMLPLALIAAWAFAFLYWPVMQASPLQATVGKAVLGMRITGYQGSRISFLRSLGRELAKILSSAVFMVGYIIAGFTARKQSLHDLVASTYVVRDGKARKGLALAILVISMVLPVAAVPMYMPPEALGSLTAMMNGLEQAQPPARPAPRPVVVAAPKPVAMTPAPAVTPALAPAPTPPVIAVATVEMPKPVVEAPKVVEPTLIEPKVVEAKEPAPKKAMPKKVVTGKPASQPRVITVAQAQAAFQPKTASGLKYNDLVTAVLYKDAEAVSQLLKLGRWPDKPDSRGVTPLMLAVEQGDARSAKVLLEAGADPTRAMPVARARRDGAMVELLKRHSAR